MVFKSLSEQLQKTVKKRDFKDLILHQKLDTPSILTRDKFIEKNQVYSTQINENTISTTFFSTIIPNLLFRKFDYTYYIDIKVVEMKDTNITEELRLDTVALLPELHPLTGTRLNLSIEKETITISWINRNNKGQTLPPQNQPKPLTIPRYIRIDESLGEEIGFYSGDGTKNDSSGVELANSCPELLKLWVDRLSQFGIKPTDLHYVVKVSENVKAKYDIIEAEIREYWRKISNIPSEKTIPVRWIRTEGKPSDYLQKYGSLTIRYFDVTFSMFYNILIKNIPSFIEMCKSFRIGFVRGLIAADGNINVRKNGSLSLVRIAGDRKQREFTTNILEKYFKIMANEDKNNQIYFGGYNNLKKTKNLRLHTLHPKKKRVFENSFQKLVLNLSKKHDENAVLKNKKAIEILKLLDKKLFKTQDIIKRSHLSRTRVKHLFNGYKHGNKYHYNGLRQLGLVSFIKNINNRCEKIWIITKKGKIFLKSLERN